MFKSWPVWPFLLACFVILTLTVLLVPEGTGRFIGAGIAFVVFPLFPLLGGQFGGKSLNDKNGGTLNSFALPVLLIHLSFSPWWLFALVLLIVWAWALSRKDSGGYLGGLGAGLAILAALIATVCLGLGAAAGHWLK